MALRLRRSNTGHEDSLASRAAVLGRSTVFRGIAELTVQRLAQGARALRLARDESLSGSTSDARAFCVLGRGSAALSLAAAPGRERVIGILGPGDDFGAEYMLAQPRVPVMARMLTEGVVVRVPFDALLETLEQSPPVAQALMRELSRRTLELTRQIESQAIQCARERVAGLLMHLSESASDTPMEVLLPAPKRIVASLLDLTKESLSRVLHDLVALGLIEVRRRTIRLLSPAGLAQICSAPLGCPTCAYCPRGGAYA